MSSSCESIPVLYIKANNNYDVGYKIGQTFKHFIRDHLTSETAKSLWSFYESKDGRKKYADSLEATRKSYPNIIEEIQGMADGSDVSFEKLFLQDMVSEILLHYSHVSKDVDNTDREVAGCTDVMVNTESCRLIGHNEDWSPEVRDGMFMVNVDLDKGIPSETVKGNKEVNNVLASRNERYLANMFPGFLAGNTFYVNETFAVSVNSLVPVSVNEGAVPVDILLRALIGCVTIEECVTVMKNEPVGCSFGINLNIASRQSANMWSLEVYPDYGKTVVSLREIPYSDCAVTDSYYIHTNHYKHVEKAEESPVLEGSRAREETAGNMPVPAKIQDVCSVLGDTSSHIEPIHRVPGKSFNRNSRTTTIASAIFDMNNDLLRVYLNNPKTSKYPSLKLPFV